MKEIVIIVQSPKGIKKYDFEKDIVSIGRSKENDIVLEDETVSSFHATLTFDPSMGLYVLMDLNSKNGTFVGENRILQPFPLEKATLISIGKNKLQMFPTEIKEGQKTVVFDLEDFKKSVPEEVKKDLNEKNGLTIPMKKEDFISPTVIEKKEGFLGEINFLKGEMEGKTYKIPKSKKVLFFGRSKECDFVFSDQRISRKHFEIRIEGEKLILKNLKSINPILLNEKEIKEEEVPLGDNSIIKVQNEVIKINFFEKTKELPKKEIFKEKVIEFQMDISYPKKDVAYYNLKGPLNVDSFYKLENSLLSNLSPEKKWAILDFMDISLIDYPALASLLKVIAEYKQRGGEILLINISEELEKTFELVNVLRYLNKFRKENLKEALKYLENKR